MRDKLTKELFVHEMMGGLQYDRTAFADRLLNDPWFHTMFNIAFTLWHELRDSGWRPPSDPRLVLNLAADCRKEDPPD